MPGFTLIYQHNGLDKGVSARTERLVNSSFKLQFISKTDKMLLLFRDGNHYPYEIIETKNEIIIVEGRIYELDVSIDKEFKSNCEALLYDDAEEDKLDYFYKLDGEFIVYVIDRKGEKIMVVNDFLGRLPQYIFHGKQFILSRDLYVLDKVTTGLLFDEDSIYQFLRLGFPLGKRSLYHDIDRLDYSSLVSIQKDQVEIRSRPINLEEMEGTVSGKDSLPILYQSFREAVRLRTNTDEKPVLSLSGGLDSRIIMGEIEQSGFHSDYATFSYENRIIQNDVTIARELGNLYQRTTNLTNLTEWKPELFDELTINKGGMNYLGMAYVLKYLVDLGHKYDLLLMGDGGDKSLAYLFPESKVKPGGLAKYILRNHSVSSRKTLNSFLLIDVKKQEKLIEEYLNELPGSNTKSKYKSFLLFERARHWLFEGEDRNRNYLWSTTPFYKPDFFKMVHSFPEREKKNFRLYRDFTNLVDPRLNKINNANWNISLDNFKSVDAMLFRQKLKSMLPFISRKSSGQLAAHGEMVVLVAALMNKGYGGQIAVYADRHDLNAASSETLFHLITLLKVSEMTWRNI